MSIEEIFEKQRETIDGIVNRLELLEKELELHAQYTNEIQKRLELYDDEEIEKLSTIG